MVQRTPGLLRADEVSRQIARMSDRFLHRLFRNLMEHDSVDVLAIQDVALLEQFDQVPGNRLALAVGVSSEIQRVGLLQRPDDRDDFVLHREAMVRVDRAFLGHEVADMAVRSHDIEVPAKILADCFGLGG